MIEYANGLGEWWIYGLSAMAGVVAFGQEFKLEDAWKIQLLKLSNRIITSEFAGAMCFMLAQAIGMPKSWIFLAVGIGAWRGAKSLQQIAETLDKWQSGAPKRDN